MQLFLRVLHDEREAIQFMVERNQRHAGADVVMLLRIARRAELIARVLNLLQSKPAGTTARTEVFLIGAQGDRRLVIGAGRMIGIGEEVNVHATNPPRAELDVARARPLVGQRDFLVPQARNQRGGDSTRGALGEIAGFRRALSCAIADGVNVGERVSSVLGLTGT